MSKVHLDAGHGGKDPGATGQGLREKDIALSITLKVGKVLERHGVSVTYSRINDTFVELSERANMANRAGADVFVSLHCNAFNDSSAQGLETYSFPGSKSGAKLAQNIHNKIIKAKIYSRNRGTKTARFAVLRQTKMPAALVEMGFITNSADANLLRTRQDDFAEAIAKGVLNRLGISYKPVQTKPAGDVLYKVQVGAFRNKANADRLANELKSKGYNTYIVKERR